MKTPTSMVFSLYILNVKKFCHPIFKEKNLFQSKCVLPFSLELAASLYSRPLRNWGDWKHFWYFRHVSPIMCPPTHHTQF